MNTYTMLKAKAQKQKKINKSIIFKYNIINIRVTNIISRNIKINYWNATISQHVCDLRWLNTTRGTNIKNMDGIFKNNNSSK